MHYQRTMSMLIYPSWVNVSFFQHLTGEDLMICISTI